jgi:hypothetical protein
MDDNLPRNQRRYSRSGPAESDDVRILGDEDGEETMPAYMPAEQDFPRRALTQRQPSTTLEWMPEDVVQDRPAAPPQVVIKKGTSTCGIMAAIGGFLLFACLLLTFATFRDGLAGFQKLTGLVPSFDFHLATPTVIIDTSRPSVVERVQAISKLETVHYQIEKVISGTSTGPLPPPLTGDKILLVAHGEVIAGVDLSKVKPEDVDEVGTAVTLTLPPPEILASKLDNDKTHVYDRQTGLFSKPDANLESQLRATAEREIVQAAQEDGILTQATQNAEQTLRTLLQGLGYKDIQFKEQP